MSWQPIETAPKDKDVEFLATDGVLLGVGSFYRHVEPNEISDWDTWRGYRERVLAACGDIPWTANGTWPASFDYLEWNRKRDAAWEAAKDDAPLPTIPNPKAGEVREWYYASAFHAFNGEAETHDYDGPVGFKPTHWMPLPDPPGTKNERENSVETGSENGGNA